MAELVPAGAWDTHIHVFDPDRFPYAAERSYTPKAAPISEYPVQIVGCRKIVIVQASIQGNSAAPLIDVLKKQHTECLNLTLRGLATLDLSKITDAELDALHDAGVRGVRFHKMAWGHGAQDVGMAILEDIEAAAKRLARIGWIIDIFCPLAAWAAMAEGLRNLDSRIRIVADHLGGSFPGDDESDNFQVLLQLVREKRIFVKLSAFERLYHGHAAGMNALEPIVKAIVDAGPDQVLFGTDWPHTGLGASRKGKSDERRLNEVEGFRDLSVGEHVRKLREWTPDDGTWVKLFVSNAERLFN